MNLDQTQRNSLQNILSSPDFSAVEVFLRELRKEIGISPTLNLSEWDFIRNSLQKEYQMKLLSQLVELMEQVAAGEEENG